MKRLLVALAIILCFLTIAFLAAWHYAPRILVRVAGKAIGGAVDAGTTRIDYKDGALIFVFKDVRLKGSVEGKINDCELHLLLRKGLYIQSLALSGFDLVVQKQQGKMVFYPVPVEEAAIRDGTLLYEGQKYSIKEVTARNFNTGKKFEFTIDGTVEGFGRIKTHGEGIFGEKHSDIRGTYKIIQLDIARVLKDYQGLTNSEGLFSYKEGRLTFEGDAWSSYFSIWEKFLTRRLGLANGRAHLSLTHYGEITEATIAGINFENTVISIKVKTRQKTVLSLELTMGFMAVPHLLEYIDMAQLADEDWGPFSYVKDGEVKIDRLVYTNSAPFEASIDLKNGTVGKDDVIFHDVDGSLRIDGDKVVLSGFSGVFRHSRFDEIEGSVSLTRKSEAEVTGKYAVSLADLEKFYQTDEVQNVDGTTNGSFRVHGRPDQGFKINGAGAITGGSFAWRSMPLTARGSYQLNDDSIDIAELRIEGVETDMTLSGSVGRDRAQLKLTGLASSRVLTSFLPGNWRVSGPIGVDGAMAFAEGGLSVKGQADLTRLAFEIPGIAKKDRDVVCQVFVSTDAGRGGEIVVDNLDVTLGTARIHASGTTNRAGIREARLRIDAPDAADISPLFFLQRYRIQGELSANISVADLNFPVKQLPFLMGNITLRRGTLLLPDMTNPFTGFDLACNFEGDRLVLDVTGGLMGKTLLKSGRLEIASPKEPVFGLVLDIDTLDVNDLVQHPRRAIAVPTISQETVFARAAGVFRINARRFVFDDNEGEGFRMSGELKDRVITVNDGNLNLGTGKATLSGMADFSGIPKITASIDLADVTARDALGLVGAETDLIEGKGVVSARLSFTGTDSNKLLKSANGTVTILSRDGVIRKWNLLAKVLGLANIYDLVQGKVDLTKHGLTYRRMSGTFGANNGVFRTTNFLIDSPSMFITGRGNVDISSDRIDGKMLVSPLVTLDKIIDWIPLINRIFKEKRAGFIFFIYDVKGSLDDPQITSSYAESMGRRVFNILMNTMRLPKDVLEMLPSQKDSPSP
jgi:hypothetical protein